MSWLSDAAVNHLRDVADWPDLSGTRYELVERLGRGGMGTVYRARDRDLRRDVALKVVDAPAPADAAPRLLREARILARLEHPGVVPVHDVGHLPDGRLFYTMKLVRGVRLDEHAARTRALPDLLRVFQRICEAVAFAHAHGVIHRDLKPQNVMVGAFGEVLVLDWGVAKVMSSDPPASRPGVLSQEAAAGAAVGPAPQEAAGDGPTADGAPQGFAASSSARDAAPRAGAPSLESDDSGVPHASIEDARLPVEEPTAGGTVLGTPGYMAPEQSRGEVERVNARADVYALGVLLEQLLREVERVPKALVAIQRKARADEPSRRYAGVEALSDDVARLLAGLPVAAHRETPLERARRVFVRYRIPILLVLAYLAMRLLLLLVGWR